MTPVITSRLWARLTPLERLLYTGTELTERLVTRAYWLTGGQPLDGWDPEDFVSYALEKVVAYPDASPAVLSTWMGQEIVRRRKRNDRLVTVDPAVVVELRATEEDVFVPTRLPEDVVAWLHVHLRSRTAEAVRIHSEEGLTIRASADRAGINRETLARALTRLRKVLE